MSTLNTVAHSLLVSVALFSLAGTAFAIEKDPFGDLPGKIEASKGRLELIAPDHAISAKMNDKANKAGKEFLKGARQIAEPFIVVGRTTKDGVKYVGLKTTGGVVWVAESSVVGAEYIAEGARFVALKTAAGVQYVAIEAIKTGKLILKETYQVAVLVIDGVEYVLVQVEDAFVFVAKTTYEAALKAGRLVINGVEYAFDVTVDGVIWVGKTTLKAIEGGYTWAKSRVISFRIRRKLATSLATGLVGAGNLAYFKAKSEDATLDHATRSLAHAALKACEAFNEDRAKSE